MTSARRPSLIVIAADFNKEIVEDMIAAAWAEAADCNVDNGGTLRVPGCYEIPLAASRVLKERRCDLLVAIGFIERGETLHGAIMGQVVCQSLLDLSLRTDTPIGIGIIGPGATIEQARGRKESYARAAVRAAYAGLASLRT